MSEKFYWNDFSAGWCPSDDPLNARPNALLKMENVELDSNGALQMSGGTTRLLDVFTNTAHSIFQKYINGTSYIYSADSAGNVFRNNTSIKTGGSTTRACFNAAYSYVFGFSGDKRFRDDGTTVTDLGVIKPSVAPIVATAVIASPAVLLTGDYEYCQINVYTSGSYQAKSARSIIGTVSPANQNVSITPQDPATPGSNGNNVWIFRRGGNLDTWYRVAVKSTYGAFGDTVSDADALTLNITLNDFLRSVNSTDFPNPIFACVGPIYGRMLYFNAYNAIFSDIYSPDSFDARTTISIGSAPVGAETFKWAIKVAKNAVLIGTDKDVYLLSGTFVQLPDGFLDVSLDPLGVTDPPIGLDVALYQGSAVYMSRSGWVACSTNGTIVNLCFPNTDLVYKGIATQECGAVTIDATGATRYSCAIVRNKLYCVVPVGAAIASGGASSIHTEVYDFLRKYWRVAYNTFSPKMFVATESGTVIGFDDTDKFIKTYDAISRKLDDGSASRQSVAVTSKCYDLDTPNVRKDLFSLVAIGGTGSSLHGIIPSINVDGHNPGVDTGDITFNEFKISDGGYGFQSIYTYDVPSASGSPLSILPTKSFQFKINGTPTDLRFKGFYLTYSRRPEQLTYLRLDDIGLTSKEFKRIASFPLIIDTLGSNVTCTLYFDGVAITPATLNTSGKTVTGSLSTGASSGITAFRHASAILQSGNNVPFEFYGLLPAKIMQVFPEFVASAQAGPIELFKYGKLKALSVRLNAVGGTSLTYSILDQSSTPLVNAATLTVINGTETVYDIPVPKTVAGSLIRIDFYAAFSFQLYSVRAQFAKSGNQTEEVWIELEKDQVAITK